MAIHKSIRMLKSFRRGMRDLGYADGENIVFEFRYGEGKPDRLPALAEALVRSKPQVLFAFGGDVSPAALAATRTIPVVFVSSADPVQLGFVKSIARPGGNATGVSLLLDEIAPKRLQMLREIAQEFRKLPSFITPTTSTMSVGRPTASHSHSVLALTL